jgi:hypothetical protein
MSDDEILPLRRIPEELYADNSSARALDRLVPDLIGAFVPPNTLRNAVLELVITVKAEKIPARDFAAYLALIDRLYGRLTPAGLRSYVHRSEGHLLISDIHRSELEIIFRTFYQVTEDVAIFIAVLLFLRSLPNLFKLSAEGVRNLAEAYKSYEEGRLIRENRKHIKETITEEPALEHLDESRKKQLIRLMDALAVEENANLPAPTRFARRQVKQIEIRTSEDLTPEELDDLEREVSRRILRPVLIIRD